MNLPVRAFHIFKEEGLRTLLHRSKLFLSNHVFTEENVWRVFPEKKGKSIISRSPFLCALYFYFRGSFYREQRAILQGQLRYLENEEPNETTNGNPEHKIIRDTHRIEKGLSMKDRKEVFAEGYVTELVDAVDIAWTTGSTISDDQLKWGTDVLGTYFDVVKETPTIERAKTQFHELLDRIDYTPNGRTPTARADVITDTPDYSSFKNLARQRSSTRWFSQEPVPHELIDKAIEVAMQSPSACNRQPYEFRIYDDPELLEKLLELPIGVHGYAENIPCLVVLIGKQRAYFHDRDKHLIYIDASLAAMAFQFALETLGLASCSINWPAIRNREEKLEKILNLDADKEAIMLMAVGYPDEKGMIPYSEKKPVDEIRTYNKI